MLEYVKLTVSDWPAGYLMAELRVEKETVYYKVNRLSETRVEPEQTSFRAYAGDSAAWLQDFDALNVRDWTLDYVDPDAEEDGTMWDLEFAYTDEPFVVVQGHGNFPDGWKALLELLNRLTDD